MAQCHQRLRRSPQALVALLESLASARGSVLRCDVAEYSLSRLFVRSVHFASREPVRRDELRAHGRVVLGGRLRGMDSVRAGVWVLAHGRGAGPSRAGASRIRRGRS